MNKPEFISALLSNKFSITHINDSILSKLEIGDYVIYDRVLKSLFNKEYDSLGNVYLITDIGRTLRKTREFKLKRIYRKNIDTTFSELKSMNNYFVLKYKLNLNDFYPDE